MHKKRIKDKDYFYTSIRDETGSVKTIYLGSNRKVAKRKERELGLSKSSKNFNLHTIITLMIFLTIALTGFFAFTGFDVLTITEEVESSEELDSVEEVESSEELDSVEEVIVSTDNLETQEVTAHSDDVSSSKEIINESENLDQIITENITEEIELNTTNETIIELNITEEIELNTTNETIIELNITEEIIISNQTEINITNETIIINQTDINQTIETTQYAAVINQPVKWKKRVLFTSYSNETLIKIPKDATNISINEIINGEKIEINEDQIIFENENSKGLLAIT
ncbi:hypothetical protein HOA59_01260, partial [archaeon]|nr:hypothetical protein [archaeon]MBT7297723.1 hypothetical protein [archaeon]